MSFLMIIYFLLKQFHGQRTPSSVYHLLKGKRSGQTIQDVTLFQVQAYFGVYPQLSKEQYNRVIEELIQKQLVILHSTGLVEVRPSNNFVEKEFMAWEVKGWWFRGREQWFMQRLSLIVQTMSHRLHQDPYFAPVVEDRAIQQFVREWFKRNPINLVQETFTQEFTKLLEEAPLTECQKTLFIHRLTGSQVTGWTWNQLVQQVEGADEPGLYLQQVATLQQLIIFVQQNEKEYRLMSELIVNCLVTSVLTDSAKQTYQLMMKGYEMEEISNLRHLKLSTIEDHMIEIALGTPSFPFRKFLTEQELQSIEDVYNEQQTVRLRIFKEYLPHLTYFQLRLGLGLLVKEVRK